MVFPHDKRTNREKSEREQHQHDQAIHQTRSKRRSFAQSPIEPIQNSQTFRIHQKETHSCSARPASRNPTTHQARQDHRKGAKTISQNMPSLEGFLLSKYVISNHQHHKRKITESAI